jgi:hypothetical protein|tara:strand:+ start:300 stop:632 length:333 start_codon:yes stop_codon:yes gene_type:complete
MRLLLGILILVLAQIGVFYQFFAPIKYTVLKNNWWIYVIAIPIVWAFATGTRICTEELDDTWGVKVVTFVAGIITFAIFNFLVFEQGINLKTGTCLLLAFIIVGIQVFWK